MRTQGLTRFISCNNDMQTPAELNLRHFESFGAILGFISFRHPVVKVASFYRYKFQAFSVARSTQNLGLKL